MPRGHVISNGRKVAALRGEADLTQSQLAREAGYGLRTIGKIENGQPTGAATLAAVATVLGRRLQRPIRLADLMQPSDDLPGEARLIEEAVKFLDPAAPQSAPPTDGLTVLLLFPEHMRARAVQGVCKPRPEEPFSPTDRQPMISPEGRLACWRVPAPQRGATYQLEWTW